MALSPSSNLAAQTPRPEFPVFALRHDWQYIGMRGQQATICHYPDAAGRIYVDDVYYPRRFATQLGIPGRQQIE